MNIDTCTMFCYWCKFSSPAQHHLCKDVFRTWKYKHKTYEYRDDSSVRKEFMAKWKELEID
jgi:hypothetical protein